MAFIGDDKIKKIEDAKNLLNDSVNKIKEASDAAKKQADNKEIEKNIREAKTKIEEAAVKIKQAGDKETSKKIVALLDDTKVFEKSIKEEIKIRQLQEIEETAKKIKEEEKKLKQKEEKLMAAERQNDGILNNLVDSFKALGTVLGEMAIKTDKTSNQNILGKIASGSISDMPKTRNNPSEKNGVNENNQGLHDYIDGLDGGEFGGIPGSRVLVINNPPNPSGVLIHFSGDGDEFAPAGNGRRVADASHSVVSQYQGSDYAVIGIIMPREGRFDYSRRRHWKNKKFKRSST
ncbi:MAG: hypothetical protein IKP28_02095 [Clostridia bacterium]|nr:hypothetical protein [Clostridia bacterium]